MGSIFAVVTEFFFSCLEPTVFLPRWEAATAVPPASTAKSVSVAITFA